MKKIFMLKLTLAVCLLVCLSAGCNEMKEFATDSVIYINHPSLNLYYGDKFQLTASPVSGVYKWTSEDEAVAKVSDNGEVEATGVGTTRIFVTGENASKWISVTVTIPTLKEAVGRPGKRRAQIELNVESDRIKTIRITRMDTNASMNVDINYQSGIYTTYYEGLAEGKYPFQIVCLDKYDKEATPIELTIQVYGDVYQSKIKPRSVKVATAFGNGIAIAWNDMEGAFDELTYTHTDGSTVSKLMPVTSKPTYVFDYLPVSEFSYRTAFLPEPTAVDTFYSETVTIPVSRIGSRLYTLDSSGEVVIKAGDFDIGGEGVGYHDTDNTNQGNNYAYREDLGDFDSRGIDLEGGGNIGYTNAGEWMMYTVYVQEPGIYTIDFRVSINSTPAQCHFEVDGVALKTYDMESSGGWGNYRYYCDYYSLEPPTVNLTQGFHKVKFCFNTGNFNYDGFKFKYK